MPVPAPPPTCAICGSRPSTCVTDWDGRSVAACSQCVSEVTPVAGAPAVYGRRSRTGGTHDDGSPMITADQVAAYIASNPGSTSSDVAECFGHGVNGSRRNRIYTHLSRLCRAGKLRRDKQHGMAATYFPSKGRP